MMLLRKGLLFFILGICLHGCKAGYEARQESGVHDYAQITFLQLNDIYEIGPVEGGKYGGLARVATIRKMLLEENPNTFTVVAGDFLSPSAIGTSQVDGKRILGAQMVDVMNSLGVDLVTFGNHEFDVGEVALQERINQSHFTWISSNITHKPNGAGEAVPFTKIVEGVAHPFPTAYVLNVKSAEGRNVRIGIIGLTIGSNRPAFVEYVDPLEAARKVYDELKVVTDFVIAITHLSIAQDTQLAEALPQLRLIIGGHEHSNMLENVGQTVIAKADANARTVYVHRLRYSVRERSLTIQSELKDVDDTTPDEHATASVVERWIEKAYAGFRSRGFDPEKVVARVSEPLDGRESSIRHRPTNLGRLIADAMLDVSGGADLAAFNSGSVRLDDQLMGTITQYDIIRTLPFGGGIVEVAMTGKLLVRVLDAGAGNVGNGGYLQTANVEYDSASSRWLIGKTSLQESRTYKVMLTEYLIKGLETNLDFLNERNEDIVRITVADPTNPSDLRRDIRLAVVHYMQRSLPK